MELSGIEVLLGLMVTDWSGAKLTRVVVDAENPEFVAVIKAYPAPTAVTAPFTETAVTVEALV